MRKRKGELAIISVRYKPLQKIDTLLNTTCDQTKKQSIESFLTSFQLTSSPAATAALAALSIVAAKDAETP